MPPDRGEKRRRAAGDCEIAAFRGQTRIESEEQSQHKGRCNETFIRSQRLLFGVGGANGRRVLGRKWRGRGLGRKRPGDAGRQGIAANSRSRRRRKGGRCWRTGTGRSEFFVQGKRGRRRFPQRRHIGSAARNRRPGRDFHATGPKIGLARRALLADRICRRHAWIDAGCRGDRTVVAAAEHQAILAVSRGPRGWRARRRWRCSASAPDSEETDGNTTRGKNRQACTSSCGIISRHQCFVFAATLFFHQLKGGS